MPLLFGFILLVVLRTGSIQSTYIDMNLLSLLLGNQIMSEDLSIRYTWHDVHLYNAAAQDYIGAIAKWVQSHTLI